MRTRAPDKKKAAPGSANRSRSIAIALALGTLVLMFYAATIVHMGGNVAAHLAN